MGHVAIFPAAKIPDHRQVSMTSMFMTSDAKLWWRIHTEDDDNDGCPTMKIWDALRKELRDQF